MSKTCTFILLCFVVASSAQWAVHQTTAPVPRVFNTASVVCNGKLVLLNDVSMDIYDILSGQWYSVPLSDHGVSAFTTVIGCSVVVAGYTRVTENAYGHTCNGTYVNVYNTRSGATMLFTVKRDRCLSAATDGTVIVFVGNDYTFDVFQSDGFILQGRSMGISFPGFQSFGIGFSVAAKMVFTVQSSPFYDPRKDALAIYEPVGQTWTQVTLSQWDMYCLALSPKLICYCSPGSQDIDMYDATSNTLTTVTLGQVWLSDNCHGYVVGSKAFIFYDSSSAAVDVYDSVTGVWKSTLGGPSSNTINFYPGAALMNSILFVRSWYTSTLNITAYNITSGVWTTLPQLSTPRTPDLIISSSSSVYFIGGPVSNPLMSTSVASSVVDIWTPTDFCVSSPCGNSTACTNIFNGYTCNCTASNNCKTVLNPCQSSPCNHGDCLWTDQSDYRCICSAKYYGDRCSEVPLSAATVFGISVGAGALVLTVAGLVLCAWARLSTAKRAPNVSHVIQTDHV